MYINDLSKLSGKEAAYYGLIGAKLVRIKQDRVCSVCSSKIAKGHQAITATKLILDGKSYKQLVDSGGIVDKSRLRKCRHWICEDCFNELKIEHKQNLDTSILDSEEYSKLSYEQQLDIANKLYKMGKIRANEMDDIEQSLLHAIALRDALANEF